MTTATAAAERNRRYTRAEIEHIIKTEEIGYEDASWLCALSTYAIVGTNPRTGLEDLAALRTVCVAVLESEMFPTGYFAEPGQDQVIIININSSVLDYDFISELHPTHDAEIYLWMEYPWAIAGTPLGMYGEWYRRDTYKDGMVAFDGKTRGWEDLPPERIED